MKDLKGRIELIFFVNLRHTKISRNRASVLLQRCQSQYLSDAVEKCMEWQEMALGGMG